MKNALAWIKANMITVVSGIVILASIGVIGWVFSHGGAVTKRVSAEVNQIIQRIDSYSRTEVPFPPANVDDPPEDISGVTINQATLVRLDEVYGKMNSEYEKIFFAAVERNQVGHRLLVPGVLPTTEASHLRHEARPRYRAAFERMFGVYDQDTDEPRLNAAGPLDPVELQMEMQRVEQDFRPGGFGGAPAAGGNLSEADRKTLEGQKAERALELLKEQAQIVHLYADPDIRSPAFPFQVGGWSAAMGLPAFQQIWDSHMELWIQQDIARAIAIANRVDQAELSVIESPVKRLISLEVVPGHVGLHTTGGMGMAASTKSGSGTTGMGMGMGRGYGAAPGIGAGAGPNAAPVAAAGSPDDKLSVDFNAGPTGRVSNAIYDVRHARMVAIVDFQQLPKLFDAIGQVNFMTVLECEIQDVDEYEALLEGFVYGSGDAVRIDMLIETIWLREWTTKLMPPKTLELLGIAVEQTAVVDESTDF